MPVKPPAIVDLSMHRLPIDDLKEHRIHLMIGRRGTGKTFLLRDIIYHMRKRFDYGVAFTPTEDSAKMFGEFIPPSCIYDSFKPEVLETLMQIQRDRIQSSGTAPSLFVIMDDCMYDKAVLRCKPIRDLFLNGRHQKVTLLIVAQYLMDLGPDLRGNVDYCFCLQDTVMGNRMKLWRHFFSVYESYADFSRAMTGATEDHKCIVLDNTSGSSELQRTVFWYQAAPELPKFYVSRRSFWRMHEQHKLTYEQRQRITNPSKQAVVLLDPDDEPVLSPKKERRDARVDPRQDARADARHDARQDPRHDPRRKEARGERPRESSRSRRKPESRAERHRRRQPTNW